MSYIECETLMKKLKISLDNDKHFTPEASRIHQQEHRHLIHLIEKLPAADVAPVKHGRWENCFTHNLDIKGHCSQCHACRFVDFYCPNCGAKMDLEG